nr:uncharacterized protein LOC113704618 [Coffea arabica]
MEKKMKQKIHHTELFLVDNEFSFMHYSSQGTANIRYRRWLNLNLAAQPSLPCSSASSSSYPIRCQWLKLNFARGLPSTIQGHVTLTGATVIANLKNMLTPENVFGLARVINVIMLATVSTIVESLLFATICTVLCNEIKANNSLELRMCRQ